jgi:hypothetical protein
MMDWKRRDKKLQYMFHRISNWKKTDDDIMLMSSNNAIRVAYGMKSNLDIIQMLRVDIIETFIKYMDHATSCNQLWDTTSWCVYDESERNALSKDCRKDKDGAYPLLYYGMSEEKINELMEHVKNDFEYSVNWFVNYKCQGYNRDGILSDMLRFIGHCGEECGFYNIDETDFINVSKLFTRLVVRPVIFTFKFVPFSMEFENKCEKLEEQYMSHKKTREMLLERINKLDEKMGQLWC